MKPIVNKKNNRKTRFVFLGSAGKLLVFIASVILAVTAAAASDYDINFHSVNGDVTGDGIVSAADVNAILSYSAGISSDLPQSFASRADLNGDGKVNAADARLAKSMVKQNVTIIEPGELTTEPLIDNSSIVATDKNGTATPVTNDANGLFNVISNEKMYIYPDLTQVMQMQNSFIIISFGWGHGVGMSQQGAIGLARAGYSYIQIVQHYFPGVIIMKENYPSTVQCSGRTVNTVEMLAQIIQREIAGCTSRNDALDMNALRAQAVAAYTNFKFSGYKVSGCSYVNSYSQCRDDVKQVAAEIAGQYIQYNGNVVYAYYSACSGGVTAPYSEIWGETSRDMSYLSPVASYYDCYTSDYISATAYSVDSIKNYIMSYDSSIVLSDNPADWIHILEHDDAVNENIGYVSKMQIGDRTLTSGAGMKFRDNIMNYDVKSPCFTIIYNGQYL